jgi:hypothetical protein
MLINEYFDQFVVGKKFNKEMAVALYKAQVAFTTKNEDHLLFFGSGLTGVYKVMTSKSDIDDIFIDILDTDYLEVKAGLREIDGLRLDFVISSDPYNLMIAYLIHRFYTSEYIDDKKKERVMFDLVLLMQYKMFTGLLAHYFKYPAEERAATATFNALSNKFLLKKLGTWQAYFNYRAGEVSKDPKFVKEVYKRFDDVEAVIYYLNAVYGAVKDVLKNIYREFALIRENDQKLQSRSSTHDEESGEAISDVTNNVAKYLDTVKRNIHDKDSFITSDALNITTKIMKDVSTNQLRVLLEDFSRDSLLPIVGEIVDETVITIYDNFKDKDYFNKGNDASRFLTDLKFLIIAKRSSDDPLELLKLKVEKYIKTNLRGKSLNTIKLVRTSLIIFICIKAFIE